MHLKTIIRGLTALSLLAVAAYSVPSPQASAAFPFFGKCLDQTGCAICCPVCDHTCKLSAEEVEESIPCFDVESKLICIPRVVFPWQKKKCSACDSCDGRGCTNCVHNGARVRRVCVLKTDKYKCPRCEYSWSTEEKGNGCDGNCDSGCDQCCDEGCDEGCDTVIPSGWPILTGYRASQSQGTEVVTVP